jgi:hypothetical protein
MYCVKVEPGKERIKVRQVASGFLPSYREADETGRPDERKRFVVPGYVFMLQYAPGAVPVPEEEWKMIEAISDPAPSTLDFANRKIVEGPLQAVEGNITAFEENRIRVYANLLGENRWYRLAVVPFVPEAAEGSDGTGAAGDAGADGSDGAAADDAGADGSDGTIAAEGAGETAKGEAEDMSEIARSGYTKEQEAQMIARAEEIGVRAAAAEYGVNWQVVAGMKRRAKNGGKEAAEEKKPAKAPKTEAAAPETAAAPEKTTAGEAAPKAAGTPAETATATETAASGNIEALKVENAILREKIEKMEAQVEKLRKALQELI